MTPESSLIRLAESVADGADVDWDLVESQAGPEERKVVRQLRVVANISVLHRTLPDLVAPVSRPPDFKGPTLGTWGDLVVIERIGGGAFADVFRAWDRNLEREVALKLLRADRDDINTLESRITGEGRLLARVSHPNIVAVYGVGKHQERVGLWMELVHGTTLEQQLRDRGPLGASEATLVGIELCRALAALHAAGLVHRDVKAQNVVREDGGRIVLMDLGTGRDFVGARGAAPGKVSGTPLYLAPEILGGAPATPQTDLYSLGVLLYRLVTASFPVKATTIEELHGKHADRASEPLRDARPDLPAGFVRVVERAISADQSERYTTAGAFEAALSRALHEPSISTALATAPRPGTVVPWRVLGVVAIMLLTVAAAAWLWSGPRGRNPAAIPPGSVHSIAVLPFANVSGNSSQDYFADGMTDELIGTLSSLHGVTVISRTSVVQFKNTTTPLKEIATSLNADSVLEGTVLIEPGTRGDADIAGRRVRINARLIYAAGETQIWAKTFESTFDDVLALQSSIARAVAEAIDLQLNRQQQMALDASARAGGGTPQNADALDLYLRGRYYWNLRTVEGFKRAIQYFQEAIDRDPRLGRAYAGLADTYNLMSAYGAVPRSVAETAALAAAKKALELDDTLAEAHAAVGYGRMLRFEWSAAEAEFRRAISLKPSYAVAHRWYATLLTKQGKLNEAMSELKTSLEQDPLSVQGNAVASSLLFFQRKYEDAAVQAQRALQLDPSFSRGRMQLAEIYAAQKNYGRAVAEAQRAAGQSPEDVDIQADLGYILAVAGRRADALKRRDDLLRRANAGEDGAAGGLAIIYLALGNTDRAFEWLERARDQRDHWIAYIKVDPQFGPLRADPRFVRLLSSVGLSQ